MNRRLLLTAAAAVTLACAGCKRDPDYYAKKIIDPACGPLAKSLAGTSKFQLDRKRIDKHVTIDTPGKLPIDVWVIAPRGKDNKPLASPAASAPTVLMLHGLTQTKLDYLSEGGEVAKKGYNVVLMDLRGHGQSGGEYIGYGLAEREDVKYVMDKLIRQGDVGAPVYVFGVTLGAATGIHYAAIEPRVKGVMAIAPYKDAESIGRWRLALHSTFIRDEAKFQDALARAGVLGGFDPVNTSAVEAVKKVKCPLLLVHGLLDLGVPVSHSQEIYEAAAEPKELRVVTPIAEQLALGAFWDAWVADQMDKLIKTGLKPTTQPATKPAPPKKPPTKKPPVKKPTPKKPPAKKPAPKKPASKKPPAKKPAPKKPPAVKTPTLKPTMSPPENAPTTRPAVKVNPPDLGGIKRPPPKAPPPKLPPIKIPPPKKAPTTKPAPKKKPAPKTKPAPEKKPAPPATMPAEKKAI